MSGGGLVVLALGVFLAALAASLAAWALLRRAGVVDIPNARSSHRTAIIRGGGIGFVAVILAAWLGLALAGIPDAPPLVIAGAFAVATISLLDDVRGVRWSLRLAVQALAVAAALTTLPAGPVLADGLPVVVDRLLLGLMWLWFVNLFNFMDGIDGIAATEALVIALGIVVIALIAGLPGWPVPAALVVAAAVAGFLPFNLPKARMFMGDVGSTTLGYTLGWLLILVAANGALATAILLGLFFVVDATSTLLMRAARRERLHEAHRHHAYQRAVDRGRPHAAVSAAVAWLGLVLVALGVAALTHPLPALALGLAATAAFVLWLRGRIGR